MERAPPFSGSADYFYLDADISILLIMKQMLSSFLQHHGAACMRYRNLYSGLVDILNVIFTLNHHRQFISAQKCQFLAEVLLDSMIEVV
ncbi:hypothetical protein A359_03970 [secondary endosymbiont of Ctenarytaina eucalypti]|uniref:Uncharacterized protein n=1 Tax=secondary endosymbiont of Ctenarytaina eucalypti TaxID=1199245 RepID=J3TXB3_9ENTR|nr:hypothetical protein A359_03970 [secondary endosymbiont of Ctenarytaina eucalypti]